MSADYPSGPVKRTSLLQRRAGLPVEAFRAHWAGPHAAIACTMPGIARYTQNRVEERLCAWHGQGPAYEADGIVELEFRDGQSAREANETEAVRRLLPEDECRFMSAITLCRVPGGARQTSPGRVKLMLAARMVAGPQAGLGALEEAIRQSGCIDFSVDPVQDTFHRDRLRYEEDPPHAFASLWFEPQVDLAALTGPNRGWMRTTSACIARGSLWRCDPLKVVG